MSIIETLTEGIVNRDMKKEGAALLNKWEATGLLEGLDTQHQKNTMARLLENQAKDLLRESNSMSNGAGIEGFASVAFPIVRRVFAGLIANDLVSVQPMSLPSGLIFFLDFVYGNELNNTSSTVDRFGNTPGQSIYGTDKVASEIVDGVNLVSQTTGENLSGPRQNYGYAYASPTGSAVTAHGSCAIKAEFDLALNASASDAKHIEFDPDLLNLSNTTGNTEKVIILDVNRAGFASADADFDNFGSWQITSTHLAELLTGSVDDSSADYNLIRRLTKEVSATESATSAAAIRFVVQVRSSSVGDADIESGTNLTASFPIKDTVEAGSGTAAGAIADFNFPFERSGDMPEIDIKVDSIAITAQTKKLKAKWTPELGQDLNAYHNLDAEVELTSILSEQIALEIDREILSDLVRGATAGTYYWSRSPGLFVNRLTGEEVGANTKAPDFTGTVSEWYETLIETINDVSAQIHLKTLRGGANYIVTSPEVANILEFTSGFRANVTADADKGTIGAVKAGSLSRKFDVIVDPYFPRNAILVGRKGGSFLESGYVYAPYVPLQTTPTIFGVEDFVPRKGVMTRYAKKMVRPDMYGLVICRGLIGETGA